MPLLNGHGDVLGGAGGAQGSLNGDPFPFQTFGGGCWLDDETVLLAIPAATAAGSVLATWRPPGNGAPVPVPENLGANDWAAGGGRWIAWLAGYGLFGSLGHLPAAGVPNSGNPNSRFAVAPDGTIAYIPDRQAGNALTIVTPDGVAHTVANFWPLEEQTLGAGRAIWRGGAVGTPVPVPALADAMNLVAVDLPDGERWLVYWSNQRGFIVQLDGASDGYILGTAGTFFNHHARAVAGELWITYSRTQGEAPQDIVTLILDRAEPREPLAAPPVEPPASTEPPEPEPPEPIEPPEPVEPPQPEPQPPEPQPPAGGPQMVYLKVGPYYTGVDPSPVSGKSGDAAYPVYWNRKGQPNEGGGWERVELTTHEDGQFDARYVDANRQLAINDKGGLETRAAGTFGGYELLYATTQPDGSSILYRKDPNGNVFANAVLTIEEAE